MSNQWNARHKLETVLLRLSLPPNDGAGDIFATIEGRSPTKRSALWTDHETFPYGPERRGTLEAGDWCHHLILCALQDKPNNPERLAWSVTGQHFSQDPLPF